MTKNNKHRAKNTRTIARKSPRVRVTRLAVLTSVILSSVILSSALLLALDAAFPLPLPTERKQATLITDRHGAPLRAFADANGVWRYPINIEQVAPNYLEALLGYEDRWFYYHSGVNPLALARAFGQRVIHGRWISGGSTLTMQVARVLDPHSKDFWGKSKQILRAMQLEWHYNKDEILQFYVNYAPFGGPIEGVQAAAFTYFNKSARELTDAEAALLAVLPQSPSRYRPDRYPQRAQSARNKLLDRLTTFNIWEEQRSQDAKAEWVVAQFNAHPQIAPLLARRLALQAANTHPEQRVIRSSIDGDLQSQLEHITQHYIQSFPQQTSAAILVMDNHSAEVLAYIGSADFNNAERAGHIDMVTAARSTGSTLKPFLYGLALDQGLIHEQSLLLDIPTEFGDYQPANFTRGYQGPVSARTALQQSLNIPAVQILNAVGPEVFYAHLRSAGLNLSADGSAANLALALGGAAASLEELVETFAAFGNSGLVRPLTFTPAKQNKDAHSQYKESPARRLLSPEAAWVINNMLAGAPFSRFGKHSSIAQKSPNIAFKTGTSYGLRDSWVLATSRDLTIGVWLGRPDGTPTPENVGRKNAVPLLQRVLATLPKHKLKPPEKPHQVTRSKICWPVGTHRQLQQPQWCHQSKSAWLINNSAPANSLQDQRDGYWAGALMNIGVDAQGQQVTASCHTQQSHRETIALWPTVLDPWLPAKWQRQQLLPALAPGCGSPTNTATLAINGVQDKSILRPAPGQQSLPPVELSASGYSGEVHWFKNQQWLEKGDKIALNTLAPGEHRVNIIDGSGRSAQVVFRVVR